MILLKSLLMLIMAMLNAYLVEQILCKFLTLKAGINRKIILFIGIVLLVQMIIFIGDLVNLIPTFIIFFGSIYYCFEGNTLQKTAVGMIFATIAFSFNTLADSYLGAEFLFSTGGRTIFWFCLFLFFQKFGNQKNAQLSDAMWKLMIVLTITPLGSILAVVLLSSPNDETRTGAQLAYAVVLILALLSVVGLLWAIRVLARQRQLEQESMLGEINRHYYETMERQQIEVRKLKHDMSNHLQILRNLPKEEQDSYLKELLENPVFTKRINYCKDATVNAVLSMKEAEMKEKGILFNSHLEISETLPFEKPDICAIFANSLDNAIEACEKLPVSARRIELNAQMKKNLFAMRLMNTCEDSAAILEAGKTTKADAMNHGYGLRSIREIVQRHEGSVELTKEQDRFVLFLYMK